MSTNEFFEATVILNVPGIFREHKATSGKITVKDCPSWMETREKLVDILFESSSFTNYLNEIRIDKAGQAISVDVHMQTTQGPRFIFNGEIMDSWPNKIQVVGYIQKDPNKARALKEEKISNEVITLEKKMELQKEVQLMNKLIDEPDLNRFRTIDWED